ncbi:MAG TPA: dihydrodipicolinate reductase C-terminal domain-containing protein [Polyangiaceae bacterium]|jgi:4-hydroxy-tetrahydrodipicolinate reductase|nr:MAG: 4-hydroxy-tetrahydrodipicolinate reductase [Deltaproteobacteria bacterium ADurb.Bin207]HQF21821.1 dihydrodipicolinate reductase C-terminal domain-containing protein [Polyangiaceae bacterium]HQK15866.1 dihydrodipicolinate reductase C-terminal domain-containing protein [Polyangiaceae bacterium]
MLGIQPRDELGVSSLRGGDVVGDHTIPPLRIGERLKLIHRVTSRELLDRGALLAVRSLPTMPPGVWQPADL